MRAAIYFGPEDMRIEEKEKPRCGEGEVLLRIRACAICGTDVRIYYQGQKNVVPPQVIGHEIAGTIEDFGGAVRNYQRGDKVILVTPVGCNRCEFCREGRHNLCLDFKALGYHYPGGFSQYMLIPPEAVKQGSLIKIPGDLPFEEASLVEPLSCCLNGQEYLEIKEGDTVVVFGAGPIGCMHVELAKSQGAKRTILVDISKERLSLAKRFSVDTFINSREEDVVARVLSLTGNLGADVVITACSANVAQEESLRIIKKRGRISFFAGLPKDKPTISLDSNIIHYKEISLFGAFASHKRQYEKALSLVSSGKIKVGKFITHTISLDELVQGIELTRSGRGLKVIVKL